MIAPYRLLEWIIWIEILFVVLLIIITFLLRFYFYLRAKHNLHIANEVKVYLEKIVRENGKINTSDFPKKWRSLDILLPLIFSLDNTIKSDSWLRTKKEVADSVLLPIARKKYKSYIWMNRLLSTQCFELWMEKEDEDHVAKLIDDKIPIIHFHAIVAAVKFGTPKLINHVIDNMSKKRRLGQTVYLKIFEEASPTVREYVEERFKSEKDNFARATCYKILMVFKEYNSSIDTVADMNSPNMELRLSAMRYTSLAKKENAIPLLLNLLSDPQWEVRAASIRLLGDLHAVDAIDQIADGLKDKSWWVRVNSANTLKSFGESGLAILNAQTPEKDKYAYETAMHVLNKK